MFKHLSTISLCLLMLGFTSDRIALADTKNSTDRANVTSKQFPKAKYIGTVKRVDDIAQQITVRIEDVNGGNGSGVIVAKVGDTYYVATAAHVVQNIKKVDGRKVPKEKIAKFIVTPNGERIEIKPGDINVANVDLDVAVVKFRSRQNYRLAQLGRYSFSKLDWVFLSGFPGADTSKQRRLSMGVMYDRSFGESEVKSRDRESGSLSSGNGLVYTNISLPGMSGGAVIDRQGRVVGINTGAENEVVGSAEINFGYALGIPIATVLGVGGIPTALGQITNTPLTPPTESEKAEIRQIHLSTLPKPNASAKAEDWLNYGNLLWRSSKNRESVAAFKSAIKLLEQEPSSAERQDKLRIAYFGMGLAWQFDGDNAAAVLAFYKAVKYVPQAYQSWHRLGQSLTALKTYEAAADAYKHAINYQRQDFVLYNELGDVFDRLKRYPEAISVYTTAISLYPSHPRAYNSRGLVYFALKQSDRAIADYNQAIKLDPQDTAAYNNRGIGYRELKQYDRALVDLERAIKLDPQSPEAYGNRGNIYQHLNRYNLALADYNQVIKLAPQLAQAYNNRGYVYMELKQYDRALADLERAIKLDPQFAQAYGIRGVVYSELKKYPQAQVDLEKAAELFREQKDLPNYQLAIKFLQQLKQSKQSKAQNPVTLGGYMEFPELIPLP